MAEAQVTILAAGRALIERTLAGFGSFVPHSFDVGTTAGFKPTVDETAIRGTRVFVGANYLMQARLVGDAGVRYLMTLPEGAGPFNVGNFLMYVEGASGTGPVPFAMIAVPIPLPKRVSIIEPGEIEYPAPGNRFVVAITLKHAVADAAGDVAVTVNVIAPDYANLPFFVSPADVPAVETNPWSQFVLHTTPATNAPALVTKRSDRTYWIMPFMANLRNPKYGVLSGGVAGDGYRASRAPYVWGGLLRTPNAEYTHNIGGRPLSYTGIGPAPVGGLSLKYR